MSLPCPRTSGDYFILKQFNKKTKLWEDDEINAEGFRTTIEVTGKHFQIGIWLPKQAAHGPYMLIFYASFWHPTGTGSVVETGLSFSQKKSLSFTATHNDNDPKKDKDFKKIAEAVSGQYYLLDVLFEGNDIYCRLGGHLIKRSFNGRQPISKVNLVIATGNRRDAFYSDATIKLLNVDGKTNFHTGHAEWMRGQGVMQATRRSVFNASFAHGMTCALPPVADARASLNKPIHGDTAQSPLERLEKTLLTDGLNFIPKLTPTGPIFPPIPNLGVPGSGQF